MKTTNWVTLLLINLGAGLLILSPFLPGPSNGLVHIIFSGGQILGLLGLIIIPIGLYWTIKELRLKAKEREYQMDLKALIVLTLPLTIFLTSIYISGFTRDFSRSFAINRADVLIKAIEQFKERNGDYPDALIELTPDFFSDIPTPLVMGIADYAYKKVGDSYSISFSQNVLMSFNFEVVTYDPTDNHKSEGEWTDLYDTGKEHWKYYVYD